MVVERVASDQVKLQPMDPSTLEDVLQRATGDGGVEQRYAAAWRKGGWTMVHFLQQVSHECVISPSADQHRLPALGTWVSKEEQESWI